VSIFNALPQELIVHVNGTLPDAVALVTSDSRKVVPGSVFVAVPGTTVDGHTFIPKALEQGATVLVTERAVSVPSGVVTIQVTSSRKVLALLSLAWNGNPHQKLTFAGVTGTNGKTTISTLVWQILTKTGISAGLLGTVRKVYGKTEVQSSLTTSGAEELAADLRRMVEEGCTHVVMEVSSHALDQDRVYGIPFSVAGFTNLTHDHLDYHKTFEAYSKAKKKLFDGLSENAIAVVNVDDAHGRFMVHDTKATVWEVSFAPESTNHILENSPAGIRLNMDGVLMHSPLVGRFNAYNVAQAYYMSMALGIPRQLAGELIHHAPGAPGRLQKVHHSRVDDIAVFVDYAHTPDALRNILETLKEVRRAESRLIVIFGCGGNRDAAKRPVMAQVAEAYADVIVVTSDNPRFEQPEAIISDIMAGFANPGSVTVNADREAAIAATIASATPGDVVVIAGKGHENYQEIQGVKHPMDDVLLAQAALEKRKKAKEVT
jgi:UDP-N-acetylmuramoyl-L-alanyl-D-glutamate--2,6-diaminopimelate ligase